MISNAADHSSTARVYYNFASLLTLPLFIPLTKPTNNNTRQLPNPNFMQLASQLVVWGNTFFCLAAMVGGYLFFRTTPDFHPTTRDMITLEDKPSQDTTDNTVLILIQNLLWTFSALLIFWSHPWKLPIYHNTPLFALFVLNVMASTAFFFITPHITDALSMEPISISTAAILLAITASAILINALYQWRIHALDLHAITI
jgi:magnesium-transporting ATPase (P-type)